VADVGFAVHVPEVLPASAVQITLEEAQLQANRML
jgi:hypothetical protein